MYFQCKRCSAPTFYLDVIIAADGPVCATCMGWRPMDLAERIRLIFRKRLTVRA